VTVFLHFKVLGIISHGSLLNESDVDSLFVIVENARFRPAPQSNTTAREFLACALNIRKFQKHTRLYRCDVGDLRREIETKYFKEASSRSPAITNDNKVEKKELEKSLHQLLGFLTPDTFQVNVKTDSGPFSVT
jgi:hypothetical protein